MSSQKDPIERFPVPSPVTLSSINEQMVKAVYRLREYYDSKDGKEREDAIRNLARSYRALSWLLDETQSSVTAVLIEIYNLIGEGNIK